MAAESKQPAVSWEGASVEDLESSAEEHALESVVLLGGTCARC